MRIAVCVKWVPAISRIRLDPETKRLVREGVPSELNAYDVLAVNRAVELKQALGGSVAVYTMGPPEARRGLVRCLAMGADDAFHLNDFAFAGADTLATSRALALALSREEYDLVLFGNNSVDAETGQVGPEVAEMLGIPQITAVSKLEVAEDGSVRAERALENGAEVVEGALPLLVSVTEGVAHDAQAPRDAVRAAEEREITELTAAMLSDDVSQFGAAGSPTWVAEVRQIEPSREGRLIQEGSAAEMAREAVAALVERGALDADADAADASETAADTPRPGGGPELWVVAEADESGLRPVTFEMLAAAQPVADALNGRVAAFVIGGEDATGYATALGRSGADAVMVASGSGLSAYSTAAYTAVLAEAIAERQPFAVLLPSTPNGRDLAARVSARLNLGLTGDCIGLDVDDARGWRSSNRRSAATSSRPSTRAHSPTWRRYGQACSAPCSPTRPGAFRSRPWRQPHTGRRPDAGGVPSRAGRRRGRTGQGARGCLHRHGRRRAGAHLRTGGTAGAAGRRPHLHAGRGGSGVDAAAASGRTDGTLHRAAHSTSASACGATSTTRWGYSARERCLRSTTTAAPRSSVASRT